MRKPFCPKPDLPSPVKVLARDRETGSVKLRMDSLDDLWHLRELVEPGDVATALTWRTAELDQKDVERKGKAEKRAMVLGVAVEGIEFQPFTNRLRLLGIIVEGPQDVGSYHTINVEPSSDITIRKKGGFRPHQEERIKEAVEATTRPLVVFLAIEDNEAVIAVLRQYGVQKMVDITGHVSGKQYASSKGDEPSFFDEILLGLRDYRPENAPLLVLGPGFAKERFMAYAREKQPAAIKGGAIEGTGQAGMTGIHEALKKGLVDRVSKDQRVALESTHVEALMEAIAKDGAATYGPAQTRAATETGAVDTLLIIDTLAREPEGEALLTLARNMGAKAHIISTHHEAGKRFEALTGVGALLRYKL